MGKKLNLKGINLKDKKYIFPLIVLVLVIIIGWFVFEVVKEVNKEKANQDEQVEVNEIQSLPAGEGGTIVSKSDAMQNAFRDEAEYTAMQGLYDPTIITSDTTIYTAEEIAYLDSLERIAQANQADIDAINAEITRSNQELSEARRGATSSYPAGGGHFGSQETMQSPDQDLMSEMIMYQKLINGEEILTPQEEQARREEQIRLEERQRVLQELNAQETKVVEKIDNINTSAFNTISPKKRSDEKLDNTIKAMVDQTTKVEQGSRIRFVLLDDVRIDNHIIKSGTHIYGVVTGFEEQRIIADIKSILVNGEYLKVDLSVLDVDGLRGLYVPKSAFRDATKAAASQAIQGGQMNINSTPDNFVGMASQALQNAYQSVAQAVSSNVTKSKATVKYNTIVYLTNAN